MTPINVEQIIAGIPPDNDDDDDGGGNGNGGGTTTDPNAIHVGDAAGGDLVGTYPDPTIDPDLLLGGSSITQDDVDASVASEAALRAAADSTLTTSVSAEATARAAAISSEAATRSSADSTLTSSISGFSASLSSESTARASADSTLNDALVHRGAEVVSVLDHGLSNNGSTDNLAAWNTLIAAINAGTYRNVYFPPGTYLFSDVANAIYGTAASVGAGRGIRIFGAGPATELKFTADHGQFFQLGDSDGSNAATYAQIDNFKLTCMGTPPFYENAVFLADGSHLTVRDLMVYNVGGLVTVGSHTGTLSGTISSVDTGTETITMSAAHGLVANEGIIFSGANLPNGIVAGQRYWVISAGLTSTALRISLTQGGSAVNLTSAGSGTRSWTGGFFNARVQRYQVRNIIGTLNEDTTNANRIWILNGTAGFYSNISTPATNLNGGAGIKNQPVSNNDQHWFTDVHFQGGQDYWLECDVSSGDCYNWVFKQCVMDGAVSKTVYLHADRADNTITDMHFLDCHVDSRSGIVIELLNNGTQDWRSIQFIGGRYRYNNDRGAYIHGTGADGIYGVTFNGCNFLQDRIAVIDTNKTTDVLTAQPGNDGTGHGLAPLDQIVFTGSTPTGITAGTLYTVFTVPSDTTFTLKIGGSPVDITGDFVNSFQGIVRVDSAIAFTDAQGVRITGCYFAGFYGINSQTVHAVQGTGGSEAYYNVSGNVALGMVTGFSTGLSNDTSGPVYSGIVTNNATDT